MGVGVEARQTKHHLFSGNQTLLSRLLVHKMLQWVRTPGEDQKVWEVVKTVLGHGKAGTQTRV